MLRVKNISFGYTKTKLVLDTFNFTLKQGEHLCVMGESGCGKSTLLKVIYGLEETQKGSIFWHDKKVLGPDYQLVPGFEKFKYVAQDFGLMPYTSVSENIKKFLSRFYPEESEKRTQELLHVIELEHLANEKVKNLSGGQQQRVAIARALAKEPELILLDEPFSQIDNFKKNSLRRRIFAYLKEKKISCIVATHDKDDALSFANKLIVIKDHKILVNDSPSNIYGNPKTKYVAALFDDVNEILIDGKSFLLYPHQINIIENSKDKAVVTNSFFKGDFWLIVLKYQNQILYCKHALFLEKETTVFLKFVL